MCGDCVTTHWCFSLVFCLASRSHSPPSARTTRTPPHHHKSNPRKSSLARRRRRAAVRRPWPTRPNWPLWKIVKIVWRAFAARWTRSACRCARTSGRMNGGRGFALSGFSTSSSRNFPVIFFLLFLFVCYSVCRCFLFRFCTIFFCGQSIFRFVSSWKQSVKFLFQFCLLFIYFYLM